MVINFIELLYNFKLINILLNTVLLKCLKVLLDTDNENNFIGLIK